MGEKNIQLCEFLKILENSGVNYWVESGTLLGLWRDGSLISHDKDIDIGVWTDQIDLLNIIELKIKGEYTVHYYYFKNKLYKAKFVPLAGYNLRKIDINFYFHWDEFACCYQSLFFKKDNLIFYYFMAFIEYAFTSHYIKRKTKIFFGKFPLSLLRKHGFWMIKSHHFSKRDELDYNGTKVKIPSSTEEYLESKYGDWKSSRKDWNFMTDDKSLNRSVPRELLDIA